MQTKKRSRTIKASQLNNKSLDTSLNDIDSSINIKTSKILKSNIKHSFGSDNVEDAHKVVDILMRKPQQDLNFLSNWYIPRSTKIKKVYEGEGLLYLIKKDYTTVQLHGESKQGSFNFVERVYLSQNVQGYNYTYSDILYSNFNLVSKFDGMVFDPFTKSRSGLNFQETQGLDTPLILNNISWKVAKAFKEIDLLGSLIQNLYLENGKPTDDIETVLKQEVPVTWFVLDSYFSYMSTKTELIAFLMNLFNMFHREIEENPDPTIFVLGGRNDGYLYEWPSIIFRGLQELFGIEFVVFQNQVRPYNSEIRDDILLLIDDSDTKSRVLRNKKTFGKTNVYPHKRSLVFCTDHVERVLPDKELFKDRQHHVIEITDSLDSRSLKKLIEQDSTKRLGEIFRDVDLKTSDLFRIQNVIAEQVSSESKLFLACLSLLPFYDCYKSSGTLQNGNYFLITPPTYKDLNESITLNSRYRINNIEHAALALDVRTVMEHMIYSPQAFDEEATSLYRARELVYNYREYTYKERIEPLSKAEKKEHAKTVERFNRFLKCFEAYELCKSGLYTYRSLEMLTQLVTEFIRDKKLPTYKVVEYANHLLEKIKSDSSQFVKVNLKEHGFKSLSDHFGSESEAVYARAHLTAEEIKDNLSLIAEKHLAAIGSETSC